MVKYTLICNDSPLKLRVFDCSTTKQLYFSLLHTYQFRITSTKLLCLQFCVLFYFILYIRFPQVLD